MAAILRDNTLTLHGSVGPDLFDDHFTATEVDLILAGLDDAADLTVKLNSGGGFVDQGLAIYNVLRARAGKVHVVVASVAASAASLIAMGGDRITMAAGSVLMMHEPMVTLLNADSADLASAAQAQGAYTTGVVGIYARRSGRSEADVRALLKATSWFDAEAAVQAGFADDVGDEETSDVPPFDYRMFAKAPSRLTAMASAKNWKIHATAIDAKATLARAEKAEADLVALRQDFDDFKIRAEHAEARMAGQPTGHLANPSRRTGPGHRLPVRWDNFTTRND